VKLNISDEGAVTVEGPKGKLQWTLPKQINASVADKTLQLGRTSEIVRSAHSMVSPAPF
jgi:ribosomal protein L6P/L9E